MNKKLFFRLILATVFLLLTQVIANAQREETLPDNGMLFINEFEQTPVKFIAKSTIDRQWSREAVELSPGADTIELDIYKIIILDKNNVPRGKEIDVKFKRRYKFIWNEAGKFFDIEELPE